MTAADARRAAVDALTRAGIDAAVVESVQAVVAELAGNAIRHARTDYTVTLTTKDDRVRVEVFDRDTRPPVLVGSDEGSTSGRGLHIIATLADDWGWQTAEVDGVAGKLVWAELALTGD